MAYLGGVALLAFVVSVILFGCMAEEEKKGNRLFRAGVAASPRPASRRRRKRSDWRHEEVGDVGSGDFFRPPDRMTGQE